MQVERYFGEYARFDTTSKKDAAALLGADNLIGDEFDIVFQTEAGATTAWMKNRFGALIGFFDPVVSRQLQVLSAREWKLKAVLSFVAYTDSPDPGHYWGEAALICYDPVWDHAFSQYASVIGKRMADGVRPDVVLGEQGVEQVIETEGAWTPKNTRPLPEKKTGTVILKNRRKFSEGLIELGRKGNKGCYAASWAFLLAFVAGVLFALKSCGVF
jgi:hypothetical protein